MINPNRNSGRTRARGSRRLHRRIDNDKAKLARRLTTAQQRPATKHHACCGLALGRCIRITYSLRAAEEGKRAVKWIVLIALLFATPALAALLRSDRKWIPHAAFALALLPFLESGFNLAVAPYSWKSWPGYVKGLEVSFIDSIAIALIFATQRVSTPWIIKGAISVYLLAYAVSTFAAQSPQPALFYGWQLVRVTLVFMAVARATAMSPKVPVAIFTGLIVGVVSQAGVAIYQWAGGEPRAGGWFGHPNLLGMVSHSIVYPAFAVFLGGLYSKRAALTVFAGLVLAFAGGSRATIGLLALGLVITAVLSMWRSSSGRKTVVAGLGVVMLLGSFPLLYSAIERRSADARENSNEERRDMNAAARMIIADYPLGAGANNYVVVANVGGYSARAGVTWNESNRAAPVHNSYYLIAAEMSILALIGFVSVLGSIIYLGASAFRRMPPGFEGDYAIGAIVTVLMIAVHAYFEWIVMLFPVHMLLALTAGLIVGVRAARSSETRAARSRPAESARSALAVQ